MVCLKKMFNGEIIFHLKWIQKRLCYYKWKAWYKLLSSSGLKKFYACFYYPPNSFLRGTKYRATKPLCSNNLKRNDWKFMFPWRKINWHVFQIAKARFRYTICFMISEKRITRCTYLHCGGVRMHQKSLNKQGIQKQLCTRISRIYEHVYTYRGREFQNVLKRKLCNCFGQLLLIY